MTPIDPEDARAYFLASLEYGVNPLVGRDTNDREGAES